MSKARREARSVRLILWIVTPQSRMWEIHDTYSLNRGSLLNGRSGDLRGGGLLNGGGRSSDLLNGSDGGGGSLGSSRHGDDVGVCENEGCRVT